MRRLKKPLLSFIALTATAALLGGVVVAMREHFFPDKESFHRFTLAVCDSGQDERTALAMNLLSGMEDVEKYASFVTMEEEQAEKLLAAGELSGIVVIPSGFIDGVLYGDNLSPKLILDRKNPIENILILSLAEGVTGMLSAAQSGIYTVMDNVPSSISSAERNQVLFEINMEYVSWTLDRNSMFTGHTVSVAGNLTLMQHSLIMGILWFLSLSAPVLFRVYSVREEGAVLVRMKSMGAPLQSYLLGKWLAGLFANLLITSGIVLFLSCTLEKLGMHMNFSPSVIGGFFLTALFTASLGYCCANLCKTATGQVLLCFLFTTAGMMAAGGIIPTLLLPPFFETLEKFSPFYYLKLCLAPLFYKETAITAAGLTAVLSLAAPAAVSGWLAHRLRREGEA